MNDILKMTLRKLKSRGSKRAIRRMDRAGDPAKRNGLGCEQRHFNFYRTGVLVIFIHPIVIGLTFVSFRQVRHEFEFKISKKNIRRLSK